MDLTENNLAGRTSLRRIAVGVFLLVCVAYSNHFSNGFEFDDFHSIVNNEYIRDIKNIPAFFTDIKYSGTNPGNQGYRPLLVTQNAIDYWLGGDLKPEIFHADIFLFYLILLGLLYILFKNIFNVAMKSETNKLLALLAVAFYGLHAANAETINYICQRSDSASTLWIVASLLLYMNLKTRKNYLYVITILLAIGSKETGAMSGPIIFFYILFFEENVSLSDLLLFRKFSGLLRTIQKSVPALIASFGFFFVIRKFIIPSDAGYSLADNSLPGFGQYFYSQWVVIAHYIGNFIIPLDLSADPDFSLYESILDRRVLLAGCLLLGLIFIAFVTSEKKDTRPIAFGILWFFVALAPNSLVPSSGQQANDHRTFLPFIGLVISAAWWIRLLYFKYEKNIGQQTYLRKAIPLVYLGIISLHAYGTWQRNIVWSSGATLWHDATIKSPNNGRAQMNYGLTLMSQGKYDETLPYFQRTLELMPTWAYIHINMGILREAMGFSEEAEQYFKNAIRFQPNVPDCYYFYARWLDRKGRPADAIAQLQEGHRISPGHAGITQYLNDLSAVAIETPEEKIKREEQSIVQQPSASNFINLSLSYYRQGLYKECIEACRKALEQDPRSALAYNNMGSSYNSLGEWQKGADACSKAIEIDPTMQIAKNNLNWARQNLKK